LLQQYFWGVSAKVQEFSTSTQGTILYRAQDPKAISQI
jgi:hypothetical protein